MTNFKRQIFSVATAGVMIANIATPAFATTIEISGNGAGSANYATVNTTNTTTVTQNNTANVTNTVNTNADTGDNKAKYNTGGDVGIQTGDAKVDVNVANDLNKNIASVDCCVAGDTSVKISGNGANSDNTVALTNNNTNLVTQNNTANVSNDIDADAETGENKASSNTGGDVVIMTGNAKVDVDVSTLANVNSARIGGGVTPTPSASFWIVGNGAGSTNYIDATLNNTNLVTQNNYADISNDIDADAETGENKAKFNTGGEVAILTGDAETNVDVDNTVNFNFADLNCGCIFDVLAKIAGNGASEDSHEEQCTWWDWICEEQDQNVITLDLVNFQAADQGNVANLSNDVDDESETGENKASSNTGDVDHESDPAIVTGDAESNNSISNSGNVNSLGEMPNVEFSFNFAALWAFFGMHS